jgi:POT family proton-dependent oligopeptide transporter
LNTIAADMPAGATTRPRQPKGLAVIFMTEMWERFSYYGMRALLVLYLVKALGYKDGDAQVLYGTYTGLVYVTPLIGGWIADKWLGMRLAAVIGGVVMMLGHFAMAVPSLLHVALGLLIIGNGFFKPNTSSMVGELYDGVHDSRRDGGYTIFYMGINLGATLSPFVCGTLGEKVGWHYGFAAAGVGMAFGLFALLNFQRLIGRAGLRDDQQAVSWKDLPTIATWTIASIALVYGVLAVWPVIEGFPLAGKVVGGIALIAAAIWLPRVLGSKKEKVEAAEPLTSAQRTRVIALCVVAFFAIFFWMGFEQAGGSMNLFADKLTDRVVFGFEIPASWFQSINPWLILVLAPFFSLMWTAVNRSRLPLPDTAKQGLGIVVLGLSFIVMYMAQMRAGSLGPVSPLWLFFAYALQTVGELMLSPIGLAVTSRSAPARITSLMMGVWLLSSSVGSKLAGNLENLMQGTGIQPYLFLTISSIAMGVLMLLLTPVLHKMLEKRDVSKAA